jgi:hypothetical protein
MCFLCSEMCSFLGRIGNVKISCLGARREPRMNRRMIWPSRVSAKEGLYHGIFASYWLVWLEIIFVLNTCFLDLCLCNNSYTSDHSAFSFCTKCRGELMAGKV